METNNGKDVSKTVSDAGFVQVLESTEIIMLSLPGLESPGKRHQSWKTLEKSWNSKAMVLEILLSGVSIAHYRRKSLS